MAKITLLGDAFLLIKVDGIIRAGLNTCFASRAFFIIQNHNPIAPLRDGLFRACFFAGGIVTVQANIDFEKKIRATIHLPGSIFRDIYEPNTIGNTKFLLARHLTGLTSPARFMIND
jgi:hypothetical protein